MMLVLAAILTAAMVLQYAAGEVPCPLCRWSGSLFGVCFGLVGRFRHGHSVRAIRMSLLWAVFLLVVSVRHVLLDFTPRPGHSYPRGAALGPHMPVWSVLIAVALLAAFATDSHCLTTNDCAPRHGRR